MSDATVILRGAIHMAGPWTVVGGANRSPELPPWPPGVVALAGDLTRKLVLLTRDGRVYQVDLNRFGWPTQWQRLQTKRAARPAQRKWLARHTYNRSARQAQPN